ncbi:DNA polymerase IV [Oleiagrimonas sp.]|jgi:DNA polymerase-4|uniref:DNA polymerase IV n=1 Tax=Oleiagrimonas sp. TaxID=2010330 RepID=UPI0026088DF9|nr:DNA polymerase IV [Oleiagrimonas sp.]MDA3912816.1 DNA polymerase IV [Oleiagrimonas sp.]
MSPTRKIIHVDMDAFYASVEQRDDPSLRNRPVVVAWRGPRSVVCAASYEARTFGVHSAMPAVRAERLCPQAVFVAPDFSRYKAVSRQIRVIFERHADQVEPLSLDEAYLDVTAAKSGLPSATATAEAIRTEIRETTQLTASAGVAPNKFLAKVASDWHKPDGQMVIRPNQVEAFLTPLEVGRIPGVGQVMQRRLSDLGIRTVGQLRTRARVELEQRFGRWGARLYELARGIDERPVSSERLVQQVSSEDTFENDLLLDELEPHIRRLAEKTWNAYTRRIDEDHTRVARTVVLKLKTADFQTLTRSLTPPQRPQSLRELAEIACALRERVERDAGTRYRLVGVGLSGFVDADLLVAQSDLFDANA